MTKQPINIDLHKQFLIKALLDIFKVLGSKIVFKGGTCALLFYDLPRFSFDLDFDIIMPLTEEEVVELRNVFARTVRVRQSYDKRFTVFFLLDYKPNAPNIKVELNKRKYQCDKYKTIWFLGVEMRIVDETTLLSNKIIALTSRREAVARDLFDVYYFLGRGFPLNEEIVKEKTGKSLAAYLNFSARFIKNNYNEKNVLQGLGEMLDEKQKQWAKKNLIKDTIAEINKLKARIRKT